MPGNFFKESHLGKVGNFETDCLSVLCSSIQVITY